MLEKNSKDFQSSNFDLKTQYVELQPKLNNLQSVSQLEALRANAPSVSASKHGLEVICGASCETGAQ